MYSNTTGEKNSSLGADAGFSNPTGSFNTYLGYFSGYNNTNGSRNIFLGYEAGYNDNYQSASDKLVIANSNTTSPLIEGDFSASTLNVNGALSATSFSGDGSGLTGIASGATNINGLSDAKTEYNAIYVGSVHLTQLLQLIMFLLEQLL